MKKRIFTGAVVCAALLCGSYGAARAAGDVAPYRNTSFTSEQRAADLCSRLTLEEKVKLMMNGSPAIPRLGIPQFDWWSEALHGVGRNGLSTVFPSCIGMAASFDDDLIEEVFTAVSDEARAKNNIARRNGTVGKYSSLSFWTPTVNIFRDPRWGRGQESYGEDPYMNGRMGSRVVRGLQGPDSAKYMKLLACAKHFAVHSGPENIRHQQNIDNVPERDLWETYLPAFKDLVQKAGVREVMCAYQRVDGQACCGSDRLLTHILREWLGFDGMVVSDCGAIRDFYLEGRHGVSPDAKAASALGVRSGTDVECGSVYRNLPDAVRRGDISEKDIDVSVRRLLAERFRVGDLDDPALVEWTRIPDDVIACDRHRDIARRMAREQMVLLKNDGILPLDRKSKVLVMGPNAMDSTMQWGIYYGTPARTTTILQGIRAVVPDAGYTPGCDFTSLTEKESLFPLFTAPDGSKGWKASYWNNTEMKGDPDVVTAYTSALSLDNGGNTAFAPGVELTDFTLRLQGSFVAGADETLTISHANDDGMRIIVNGDTIHNRWKGEALNYRTHTLPVRKGQKYDIEVNYMQLKDAASLNFDILRQNTVSAEEVAARADGYDVVVFAGGITPAYEREEAKVRLPGFLDGDRTSIEFPEAQRKVIEALHKAGKKVVLVNCSGSAVALVPESGNCDAILQAWYPGEEGGTAVADVLFGDFNPQGKLPVTFYAGDSQLPPFEDYRMEGRTYRFMRDAAPLYPFGHGLSYTTFAYGKPRFADGRLSFELTNTGTREGTEVVQVYLRRPSDKEGPVKTLRGYERVTLRPGESRTVCIDMPAEAFHWWNPSVGDVGELPGEYELLVGPSSDSSLLQTVSVTL